ncbi:MAG: hypothetical protein FJ119_00300 [Deltaproteobacteria bacterium]|nr:hypothetical protein [Deltaproteobacteria bacterium]
MKTTYSCLLMCAIFSILTACDNSGQSGRPGGRLQVQESEDGIEVRGPDGTVLIKGNHESASILLKPDDGEGEADTVDINTGKLAPKFPADIPVLPESTVVMSQVFQGGRNAIATITTQQPAESVILFYEEQIQLKGWEPGSRYDLDNIVMLNGKKGTANLNVSITTEADLVTINTARTESTEK